MSGVSSADREQVPQVLGARALLFSVRCLRVRGQVAVL